jgi:hypothetical protein
MLIKQAENCAKAYYTWDHSNDKTGAEQEVLRSLIGASAPLDYDDDEHPARL